MNTIFNEFRTQKVQSFTSNQKRIERARITKQNDTFEINKSNNGKFDVSEAGKNLVKGITSPITAMIKHPIATIGVIAATAAATTFVPVLCPVLVVGFGAASLYQIGKGTYDAAKNYKNGNYDDAEKSFDKIGQGIIGTVMSAIGIKQSAKIAQEAKLMSETNINYVTRAQRNDIAAQVNKNGFFSAVKDNVKVLTTKGGLKSIANQLKPSSIKDRYAELMQLFKPQDFKKTPEGIRRANLTDEQIQQEVSTLYNEAFERLGIPQEQRPNLKIQKGAEQRGGGYSKNLHEIEFNPEAYKAGYFELEDTMMHEATHCREALLRAGIPQDRVNLIVKEQLISRVMNGESEQVLVKGNFCGADMMRPPKMSPQMKKDFVQFAENELYQNKINNDLTLYTDLLKDNIMNKKMNKPLTSLTTHEEILQPILNKLNTLINKNPEFVQQYGSTEEAMAALLEYSVSHNVRYNIFTDAKIKTGSIFNQKTIDVPQLNGEKLAQAEQSLVDNIATLEGNARNSVTSRILGDRGAFNQYQFSPEEVLAQKNGNNFVIEKFTNKISEMKSNGSLTPQEEVRLLKAIDKAIQTIEYKTKGLDYYKQYTQMINNPDNIELAQTVKVLEHELNLLKIPNMATTMAPNAAIYNILAAINNNDNAK